jgi:hypothetical protein
MSFRDVLTRHCTLDEKKEADLIALAESRRGWLRQEFGAES